MVAFECRCRTLLDMGPVENRLVMSVRGMFDWASLLVALCPNVDGIPAPGRFYGLPPLLLVYMFIR